MESLVLGGAMDSFGSINRAQYFESCTDRSETFTEALLRYGNNYQSQKESNQMSLFGDSMTNYIDTPRPSNTPEWSQIEKLEREKEVTGIYISGHPLDDYHLEFRHFINCPLEKAEQVQGKLLKLGGIVTEVTFGTSQKGTGYARFTFQDFTGSLQVSLYNEQFESFKHLLSKGQVLYVEGINEKGYQSDRFFFRVKDIRMLDTIGKTLTKSLTIKLPLHQIDEKLIYEIEHACLEKPGPHTLKLKIVEEAEDLGVDLVSGNLKVNADYQLIQVMENLGLAYKLN
jgi:DNA polymerase-3 subunit alpha